MPSCDLRLSFASFALAVGSLTGRRSTTIAAVATTHAP
jgi:hypothetical protein